MLVFFDETFRPAAGGRRIGALCGIVIPEDAFAKIASDVYYMKYSSFGESFAKEKELKGSTLLKPRNLRPGGAAYGKTCVEFVRDLLRYIRRQQLVTVGVVCFDPTLHTFKCSDPHRLDITYRIIFERIDAYMQREFPQRRAKLVFDDVDYGTNKTRAESITNFFNRTAVGRGYDSIIRTPFFSVSQAQNIGLQLADLVTTVYGIRFQGVREIQPLFLILKKTLYSYRLGARRFTTLKVFKDWTGA